MTTAPKAVTLRQTVLANLRRGLITVITQLYFYAWSYKSEIRHKIKVRSLGVLSLSTFLLIIESTIEWRGSQTLHGMLISPVFATFTGLLFVLFVSALLYLIYHHYRESRKPGYEYRFVQELAQFMQERQKKADLIDNLIPRALQLFHHVFEPARVRYCSVHLFDGEDFEGESLSIRPKHMYPQTDHASYRVFLKKGEGVAGLVCADSNPRYIPRFYFPFAKPRRFLPTIPFHHAIKYAFYEANGFLHLTGEGLDPFAFKKAENGDPPFRSMISVPVVSAEQKCYGALNFDFAGQDPLDKIDIAMALVFGKLLGDEIERTRQGL